MKTTSDFHSLKSYLLRLLSTREYSLAELRHKALCHRKSFSPDLVEQVLSELQQLDLQNDARFVASYLRSKASRGQGLRKIQSALHDKGISREQIQQALADAQSEGEALDFAQSALALYQRKYPNPPQTPQERAKRMRFLASRGFDFSTIQTVMKT
ncbi:MAG: regulatory protein RecX [Cardiobacteriaceae bacterium]|nr:regulatory protein RecX [Cardiobacteriaceae bacterium]